MEARVKLHNRLGPRVAKGPGQVRVGWSGPGLGAGYRFITA